MWDETELLWMWIWTIEYFVFESEINKQPWLICHADQPPNFATDSLTELQFSFYLPLQTQRFKQKSSKNWSYQLKSCRVDTWHYSPVWMNMTFDIPLRLRVMEIDSDFLLDHNSSLNANWKQKKATSFRINQAVDTYQYLQRPRPTSH